MLQLEEKKIEGKIGCGEGLFLWDPTNKNQNM
jgi:hypothetical protein